MGRRQESDFHLLKKNELKLFKWVFNYKYPSVNLIMIPFRSESQTSTRTPIIVECHPVMYSCYYLLANGKKFDFFY